MLNTLKKEVSSMKSIVTVVLMLFILMLVLPITTAELQPLAEQQITDLGPGRTGMLAGGISVIDVTLSSGEYTVIETSVVYFNTGELPAIHKPYPMAFWEEREHTVKENYIYYLLPSLNWVSIKDEDKEISIPENYKYYVNVTVTIPNEEAREKSKEGGFIFLIASEGGGGQISAIPARKIFLTINHIPTIFSVITLTLMLSVIAVVAIVMFYISKKIKIKTEVEEDHV